MLTACFFSASVSQCQWKVRAEQTHRRMSCICSLTELLLHANAVVARAQYISAPWAGCIPVPSIQHRPHTGGGGDCAHLRPGVLQRCCPSVGSGAWGWRDGHSSALYPGPSSVTRSQEPSPHLGPWRESCHSCCSVSCLCSGSWPQM